MTTAAADDGVYRADVCDLCGARAASVLVRVPTGRAMRSDGATVAGDLLKLRCDRCGLVREGHPAGGQALLDCYTHDYAAAPADYVFYTPQGPVPRSALFADWMVGA